MGSKQHTTAIAFTAKTIFLAAILLVGYYFGWLRPQLVLPKALIEAQAQLAQHHAMLLQNRLALTELTRLDSASATVHEEKGRLLATLEQTNQEGLKVLDNAPPLPNISGAPTAVLTFLNTDLAQGFRILSEEHRSILEDQQALLENLKTLDMALTDIFRYHPAPDLGTLDPTTDRKELLKRSQAAQKGLRIIADTLTRPDLQFHDLANVLQEVQNTLNMLNTLIGYIESGDAQQVADTRTTFVDQFTTLKALALDAELALIKSDTAITLLTTQTNLILEYDYWLSRISVVQQQLAEQES